MMTGNTFKLKTDTMAILSEGDHRSVILIPATAQVILVGGDIKRDTFVKIPSGVGQNRPMRVR
jgi:hypothetical protein